MIPKILAGRRDRRSSFNSLRKYLTEEVHAATGERRLRGEHVLSDNLLSLKTAAHEMQAVAAQNTRVDDPVLHYQIAWAPGEKPRPEQWKDVVSSTINALGYREHQYVAVAHADRAHFHVHVMINRVHPETYLAHNPLRTQLALHKTARELEHKYGWKESPGLYRWDAQKGCAVRNSRAEMREASHNYARAYDAAPAARPATDAAAKMEYYNDRESLVSYAKGRPAADLHALLLLRDSNWQQVHALLYRHGLAITPAERGGYTVQALGSSPKAKASEVFRADFSGAARRAQTDAKLGRWEPPDPSRMHFVQDHAYRANAVRDPEERSARRAERAADRAALKAEYKAYRASVQKSSEALRDGARSERKALHDVLKAEKARIRQMDGSWLVRRAIMSTLQAQSIVDRHAINVRFLEQRAATAPKSFREWVSERAEAGDARAAAQLRGWHYQDQRNEARREREIRSEALERRGQFEAGDCDSRRDVWDELANRRLKQLKEDQSLAAQLKSLRWSIDCQTGDVRYFVNNLLSVVDHGRVVTVLQQGDTAALVGLEMAVAKFGPSITVNGTEEWKARVAELAARHHVGVRFTDTRLQQHMEAMQRELAPVQRPYEQAERALQALHANRVGGVTMPREQATSLLNVALGADAKNYLSSLEKRLAPGAARTVPIASSMELTVSREPGSGALSYHLRLDAQCPDAYVVLRERIADATDRANERARAAALQQRSPEQQAARWMEVREDLLQAVASVQRGSSLEMSADHASVLMDAIFGRPQGRNFVRDIEKSLRTPGSRQHQILELGTLDAMRTRGGVAQFRFTPNAHALPSVVSAIQQAATFAEDRARACLQPKPLAQEHERGRERGMER